MKKLLLLLFVAAYLCVSCNDKPTTMALENDDDSKWKPEDTCSIRIDPHPNSLVPLIKLYKISSTDVDFLASVNSVYRHNTITLKNGSYAHAIDSNMVIDNRAYITFDSGHISSVWSEFLADSLRYDSYLVTFWYVMSWGPNCTPGSPRGRWDSIFLYKDITLDKNHTSEDFDIRSHKFHEARGKFEAL